MNRSIKARNKSPQNDTFTTYYSTQSYIKSPPRKRHTTTDREPSKPQLSTSAMTPRAEKLTLSVHENKPNTQNLLEKISDFRDKKQISEAVLSIPTYQEKLKFLDSIIERRAEICEIENHRKLQRVIPFLSKVGQKFRKVILAKSANKFKKALQQQDGSGESIFSSLNQSMATSRKDSDISSCSKENQPQPQTSRFGETLCTPASKLTSPFLRSNENFLKSPQGNESLIKIPLPNESNPPSSRTTQIKSTAKVLALLTKNKKRGDSSPKHLVFYEKEEKTKEREPENDIGRKRESKINRVKFNVSPKKDVGINKTTYELGAHSLEKDLYKYLVKYENKDSEKRVVTEVPPIKESLMKDIEDKAKARFSKFMNQKRQMNYMLPNSLLTKSNQTERLSHKNKDIRDGRGSQSPLYQKRGNFFLVKTPQNQMPSQEQDYFNSNIQSSDKDLDGLANDDSFTSLTETKLDKLYRIRHSINKTIYNINEKMKHTEDKQQLKKYESMKQKKLFSIDELSKETFETLYRKMKNNGIKI